MKTYDVKLTEHEIKLLESAAGSCYYLAKEDEEKSEDSEEAAINRKLKCEYEILRDKLRRVRQYE